MTEPSSLKARRNAAFPALVRFSMLLGAVGLIMGGMLFGRAGPLNSTLLYTYGPAAGQALTCLSELNGARQGAAAVLPGGGIRRAA